MGLLVARSTWKLATPIIIAIVVAYGIKMLIGYVVAASSAQK